MSHSENKIGWCLKKAEKELLVSDKHRGLVKIKPDLGLARLHLSKAEHNLKAIMDFKRAGYSDWSSSAAFYSVYHCFLAILAKFGFESRNQECTFAVIYDLIDKGQVGLSKVLVEEIHSLDLDQKHESAEMIDVREETQYGVKLSLEDDTFERLLDVAKKVLDNTKEVLLK